ncbi:Uncharacterised protein [Vibrio cholerae]|nr:Uncharacterised protein [Vibrio cholerae]CSD04002.1 Uncharacterised protein [Vibrio cholerae]
MLRLSSAATVLCCSVAAAICVLRSSMSLTDALIIFRLPDTSEVLSAVV